ncbi:hypothetical protein [Caulobacter endophyticus]|uniref:hypothetical protein n=1 Tax=Caulobacter endophyticus TaxID=2172652 RepID=UPI0024103E0B|nr:hypothetical protein [Caulobacter endophyticus]MDG2527599.1 hypothetical protein [Caulobacter endophyticus]
MTNKNLKISQLKLDLDNPRINKAADQHEAMQKIIDDGDNKLANLAESIVDAGRLNPMERLLVMADVDGKFIALEGNRRTLALKLLAKPALMGGLKVSSAFRKRIERLSARFDRTSVEPISCFVVPDRAESATWIEQRHSGEDEGRGVVRWSAEQVARFLGNDPALQALEFVRLSEGLTSEEKEILSGKFPITTLDRLLSTPSVRVAIGFDVMDGKLVTGLPKAEAIKPLKRIVLDLASKKMRVTALKSVKQQNDYVAIVLASDGPDLSQASNELKSLDSIGLPGATSPAVPSKPRQPRPQKVAERTVIVPGHCRLNITNNNTGDIYGELLKLKLRSNPNAIAVLLRVFMENSTDHYLVAHGITLKFQPNPGARERYKSLDLKVREAVDHMVAAGAESANFDGVRRALSNANHPLSIDLQHAYVHNRYVTPSERDLIVAWDNAQAYFEKIWP